MKYLQNNKRYKNKNYFCKKKWIFPALKNHKNKFQKYLYNPRLQDLIKNYLIHYKYQ